MNNILIERDKFKLYYEICCRWLYLKNKGKTVSNYLKTQEIESVVIYGCGDIGKRVIEELLKDNSIEVIALDKNASIVDAPVKVINPFEETETKDWKNMEMAIITSEYYFDIVYTDLRKLGYEKIIVPFSDILMKM